MDNRKLHIRFVINKTRINKAGKCPIKCRITLDGKRKVFNTGKHIEPELWIANKQRATGDLKSSKIFNVYLEMVKNKIVSDYLGFLLKDKQIDVEDVYTSFKGTPRTQKVYIIAYFKGYLEKLKKLINKDIELGTWKKYNYACIQAQSFIKWKHNRYDLSMDRLKHQFLSDFEYYLKTERNQNQVTINKTIQRFRKPIRLAMNEGVLTKDPFRSYKPGTVKKNIVFLSTEELNRLEDFSFAQPRLQLVKDLFVLCCYTGLPFNEMSLLKVENISKGFDDMSWIRMNRQKTGKEISVPVLSKANIILNKLDFYKRGFLPKISNQKFNSYLKEIANIIGVEKRLTHHTARKTFASTVLLFNNVPIEIVSELLGHSSIKITQSYYGKIVQTRVSQEMMRIEKIK